MTTSDTLAQTARDKHTMKHGEERRGRKTDEYPTRMESHVLVLGTMLELPLGNKLSCSCRGNVSLSLPDIIERQNSDGHGELGEAVEGQCGQRRRGAKKG